MKKNPIDDLFAKKLAEHRQEPSQKALEKFQERLAQREQKRRGGIFVWNRQWNYYAAAASVVAVLSIGVFSIRDKAPQLAQAETPKQENIAQNQPTTSQLPKVISVEQSILPTKKIEKKTISSKSSIEFKEAVAKVAVQKVEKQEIIEEVQNTNEIAVSTVEETSKSIETPQITAVIETIEAKPVTEESIVVVYNELPAPSTESIAKIETDKEDEKSFISKLFKEYQHLKYGEKVDLKTLGINKREVMARVDERFFKEEREDLKDFMQSRIGRFKKIQE